MKTAVPFATSLEDIAKARKVLYTEGLDEICWMLDELVACRTEIMDLRLQNNTLRSKIAPPRVQRITAPAEWGPTSTTAPVQLELELTLPEKDPNATAQR